MCWLMTAHVMYESSSSDLCDSWIIFSNMASKQSILSLKSAYKNTSQAISQRRFRDRFRGAGAEPQASHQQRASYQTVLMRRNRTLLKGWVTLWINIRLKGYVYRQHLHNVRQGNSSTTTLPLEVFTQETSMYSIKLEYYSRQRQIRFWATLWGN